MSNLRKLTNLSQWKPRARERALLFAMISGPLSLLLVLAVVVLTSSVLSRLPKPVDTYAAITDVTRVQNFARNSMLLWLGGSTSSEKPLLTRSSAAQAISLSEVPFEVRSIDPSDIVRWQGADAVQWQVTFAVTFVAPGSSAAQINRFSALVLDRDGDYQLVAWPSIVNIDTTPFKVASKYTVPVDVRGSLGQSLNRFVTAYLTSTGGATSLGQYVSAKFRGSAIADSPYSTATIQEIKASSDTPNVTDSAPGTELKVLVRVKADASIKTWSVMDLALRVSLGANNVWLVDGIDAPIGWGAISGT
ncbi:conjugal transfer protein [Mycolicibacterium sp.]|uniref:conjugal transfer protein n=1 Tax=Mycolicibacterium sp. TaxID=2320850 RepID=UPI00355F7BB3